jgi:hypothetical protein
VLPLASGEVVVLADARQRFDDQAIRMLVANFADPRVGAVSGELVFEAERPDGESQQGVGLYWRCEKAIRRWESLFDSTVGATGAIYAVRKSLIERMPDDTILDDVEMPMSVVRQGARVIFEPRAIAYDRLAISAVQEFVRKERTIAGTCQLLWRDRWMWSPARNRLWVQTVSHKAVRLASPLCHAALLTANLWLLDEAFYKTAFAAHAGLILAASIAALWPSARARVRGLAVAHTMAMLNIATVVGIGRFLLGRQAAAWDRTAAPAPFTS